MEYSNLPECVPSHNLPEVVYQQQSANHTDKYHIPQVAPVSEDAEPNKSSGPEEKAIAGRRICGLASRTFYILLAIGACIIVGVAVGGGVGGVLASRSSTSAAATSNATTTSASTTPTTTTPTTISASKTASVTTTEVVGPTSTLYRDCPSSNDTLYSVSFGSDAYLYRKFCSMSLVDDGTTLVNKATTDLSSCINLCAAYNLQNATEIASGDSQPCNAVCWRNGFDDDDFPGQCFGSTTQNSSTGGFNLDNTETICDSAGWINQT